MSPLTDLPTQAEVWLVDFGPGMRGEPVGRRPAIVVAPSIDHARQVPTVTVIPLTRRERAYVFRCEIPQSDTTGLVSRSFAQVDQIRAVNKDRLLHYAGYVDADTWGALNDLVRVYLDA